jgi:acyl-CoA thioesterase-1
MNAFRPTFVLCALALGAVCAADSASPTPEAGSHAETSKNLRWVFSPEPALPNVLILGDSISIGYTLPLRKMLGGKANIFRPMTADGRNPVNCSGTTLGVNHIDGWLDGRKWDVIHFNWGLHDLKHVAEPGSTRNSNRAEDPVQATEDQYGRNLEVLVGKLKATGARLVFATTTPVAAGTTNPLREAEAPSRYNAIAMRIMEANGVRVNDLFALCQPRLQELQLPKNVHFTAAGSEFLAGLVAPVIAEELATRPSPPGAVEPSRGPP